MGGGTVASGAPIVDTKSKEYRRDEAFLHHHHHHRHHHHYHIPIENTESKESREGVTLPPSPSVIEYTYHDQPSVINKFHVASPQSLVYAIFSIERFIIAHKNKGHCQATEIYWRIAGIKPSKQ